MKLSVVIPVYNEARTVGEVIERVAAVPFDKEIIAVDDGSTDTTGEELQLHTSSLKQIHSSRVNFGKGAAIRIGLTYVTGDVVIMARIDQDGDAISKQPNDIVGQVRVKVPAQNANITLDTLLP